jgi:rfaE bifunctional protein nucleotidyltransferase chain/domain
MIVKYEDLSKLRTDFKLETIVLCHGCFDLFHIGHLNYIKESKKHGTILLVSLTNDKFIKKGNNRPLFNINDRISIINELKIVDYCCVSDDFTCVNIIKNLKPNIFCKGIDVKGKELIPENNLFLEHQELKKNNGQLIFVNSKTKITSTQLLNFYD